MKRQILNSIFYFLFSRRRGFIPLEAGRDQGEFIHLSRYDNTRSLCAADYSVKRSRLLTGFTLIEILVVVAITAMISAYAITYSRLGNRQVTLYIEEQKMAELVFRAKSLAISTYINPPDTCGYGFMIDYEQRNYSLFSYSISDIASPDCDQIRNTRIDPSRVIKQQAFMDIPLSSDIVFPSPLPADAIAYVLFVPPDPMTIISADEANGTLISIPGKIYLETIDGNGGITITVNRAGQVDF